MYCIGMLITSVILMKFIAIVLDLDCKYIIPSNDSIQYIYLAQCIRRAYRKSSYAGIELIKVNEVSLV